MIFFMIVFTRRVFTPVAATLLILLGACATNPVTGQRELSLVSENKEIAIGEDNYGYTQQTEGGPYRADPALSAYVSQVGQALARVSDRPGLPYEFVVLNSPVPNAWALPGGKIAINLGLLTELNSEAELAAVLGHEIVHAAARHGARQMERGMVLQAGVSGIGAALGGKGGKLATQAAGVGAKLIHSRYGRDHELESDHYGMIYMVRAGYNPSAATALQETFVRLSEGKTSGWMDGLFASHPPSRERVEKNRSFAAELNADGAVRMTGLPPYRAAMAKLNAAKAGFDLLQSGNKALSNDAPGAALDHAISAIAIAPEQAAFYDLKGRALVAQHKPKKAANAFGDALVRNDGYFAYHLARGLAYQESGNDSSAQSDLIAANTLLPTVAAHLGLGEIFRDAGDTDRAIAHFRKASGSGELGSRAAIELARLELPISPERYIAVSGRMGSGATLLLDVTNKAPISVQDIHISITGRVAGSATSAPISVHMAGPLKPGQQITQGVSLDTILALANLAGELTLEVTISTASPAP
jgi:predicted Zn-dependent protease